MDDEAIEDNTWMSEDNEGKDDEDEQEDDRGNNYVLNFSKHFASCKCVSVST